MNRPGNSALRGKCTQRNFWIGQSVVGFCWDGCTLLVPGVNESRLFSLKNWPPPGSWYSMAKPAKSSGGVPLFQFIASSSMPSPRCSLNENSAVSFVPVTSKSSLMARTPQVTYGAAETAFSEGNPPRPALGGSAVRVTPAGRRSVAGQGAGGRSFFGSLLTTVS